MSLLSGLAASKCKTDSSVEAVRSESDLFVSMVLKLIQLIGGKHRIEKLRDLDSVLLRLSALDECIFFALPLFLMSDRSNDCLEMTK